MALNRLPFCIKHSALGLMLIKSAHVALQGLEIQHVLHADPKLHWDQVASWRCCQDNVVFVRTQVQPSLMHANPKRD